MLSAIILGVVQGLTEFLPVSSSAHLVIAGELVGLPTGGLTTAIVVHLGTLLAVVIVFWTDLVGMVVGFLAGLWSGLTRRQSWAEIWEYPGFRLSMLVAVGSLPALVAGLLLEDYFSRLFASTSAVGGLLLVTGALLWVGSALRPRDRVVEAMKPGQALFVGIWQALAILPGISRSGSTVVGGLLAGLRKEDAARFSFLMSVPAILGASLVDLSNLAGAAAEHGPVLLAAFAAAAISGFLAIRCFLALLRRRGLRGFAYYCWAAGLVILVWQRLG
ncbi:MAG: undecaprenyl-diphosphate phosphatase [Bacillota bacterium]